MQVIGQQNARKHFKCPATAHRDESTLQQGASVGMIKQPAPTVGYDREKIGRAMLTPSSVVGHTTMLPNGPRESNGG
jgi:hypothetical protein